jgi:hypothetical protein
VPAWHGDCFLEEAMRWNVLKRRRPPRAAWAGRDGFALGIAAALVWLAGPAAGAPPRVEFGEQTLVRNGEGTRDRLGVDVYRLTLYVPERTTGESRLRSPDQPVALRYEMLWPGPVPDEHPKRWQEELLPVLSDAQVERLRENLKTMGKGDVLWIRYVPGQGTTVERGDRVLVRDPSRDVMDAYLNLWLGSDPLSDGLREDLLAGEAEEETAADE